MKNEIRIGEAVLVHRLIMLRIREIFELQQPKKTNQFKIK